MTGGRLKQVKKFLKKDETFMFTYGDALANIDLKKLLNFHKLNQSLVTVTAVRPPARFGELSISKNLVTKFEEKPQLQKGWINGGLFVVEPEFLKLIGIKNVMLERSPLTNAVNSKNLAAFKHTGFWFCMDTLRDKIYFVDLIRKNKYPWMDFVNDK